MDHDVDSYNDIVERALHDNIHFIQLQFTDIHGYIKAVTLPVDQLHEALTRGVWFDGSSIEGFTRICESDMYLKPDPQTYASLPWGNEHMQTARLICDIYTPEGQPFEGDPRFVLKRILHRAEQLGFSYKVGPELEFFLFKPNTDHTIEPMTNDNAGYFDFAPRDSADVVRKEIIQGLQMLGLEVEMSHHEVSPGQHEINFKYDEALKQADHCNTFKYVVKSTAQRHNLYASFMPKPIYNINGSGMHVHQSLFDITSQQNVFFDASDTYKLSSTAKHFIAGQLIHAKAISAITSPTVNSYKRLVPGYEAPVYICWGAKNRSALVRIPRYSPGREQATRCELRSPDPSCNPYLAFAVMLAAGLDGIQRQLSLPEPTESNVFALTHQQRRDQGIDTLPGSLFEACAELEKDPVIIEALGPHIVDMFLNGKRQEWTEFHQQITPWELQRYLEYL